MDELTSRAGEDREARARAQTVFDRPLLLEAGAGTGKTAVLVARIVTWCLGEGWERSLAREAGAGASDPQRVAAGVVRRVVAITFTEAAAAEMASRVAEVLLAVCTGRELPQGVREEALPSDPSVRGERAEALVGVLDQLPVRTIHAFCRRLLLEHPFALGLHPGFEVDADGQRVAEIAREVLEAHLPEAFGDPPDADFAVLLASELGPGDVEAALVALLREGVLPEDLRDDPLASERIEAFVGPLARALGEAVALEDGRLANVRGSRIVSAAALLSDLQVGLERRPPCDVPSLEAWLETLREVEEEDLKTVGEWARGDAKATVAKALGEDLEPWTEAMARIHPLLAHARKLRPAALHAARRVLRELLARARERMRGRGVESFGGLLRGARDLLAGHPEVARRVRGGMDQLLVDEFQDTDALQCEILEVLALAGEPGTRPTLFLVGDPKQSIYGWRNADLRAYDAFGRRVREAGGEVAPLVVNHRSVPAILREVERCVRPVMREAPGRQPPFEALEADERRRGREGYTGAGHAPVEHWLLLGAEAGGELTTRSVREANELEAKAVARDLAALREAGADLGKVGLLLRATSDFEVYLAALRDAGLRFVVERETRHYERREVVDAMALVRCVLDPHDHLALVATLRSPAVGVPDAALVPLWTRRFPELVAELGGESERADAAWTALDALADEAAAGLSREIPGLEAVRAFPDTLRAFLASLAALRRLHEEKPAEDFVEALRAWLLPEALEAARYLGRYRAANLDRFLRELTEALESSGGSAATVVAHLRRAGSLDREHEEGRPRTLAGDAVQVMTIHRAKGLAFDHVYLLQTHKGSGRARDRRTEVVRRRGAPELVLMDLPSPGLVLADAERDEVEACERVRLLYVAATRARERLVISGQRLPGETRPLEKAGSHAHLLGWREETAEDLRGALEAAVARGEAAHRDAAGVLWRLPAFEPEGALGGAAPEAVPPPADVAGDARVLEEAERRAHARAARPVSRAASDEEGVADEETLARLHTPAAARPAPPGWQGAATPGAPPEPAPPEPEGRPDPSEAERRIALAAGTAVHAALEHLDPEVQDAARAAEHVAASLAGWGPAEREAAGARALAILERFLAGPLAAHLRELAPHVVARELPVLLPPREGASDAASEPVGYWSGAIDLVHRDPASGAWVAVDYKTDAVGPAELEARTAFYTGQARVYARALQEALGLPAPPRFELWFLQAGERVLLSEAVLQGS